ncbi:MAG: UDP-N-acetylglucosamine 1-carboxyvinyltransferase [Bacteroidetes bacterium]|nr:UDP-N-acetylglucosamine 1-carboxyvinyltransferase [Bacteroidota bacterium]MBU1114987.1 UDP-N-acetylglucosamine 1-carboxyvinyltransferase [Bacteroidota bacterium]MBU1797517.1 UDP-N-acetylglucosamine 1-carboxyvinyltransferase [Bacteroidota bacterium]
MDKFVIEGGHKLSGRVKISGAKNSALALMPAVLLNNGINKFENIPEVNDIFTMIKLLKHLGVSANFENNSLELDSTNITNQDAPYEHVKKMRASVYVLGPLLARYGYSKVSMPGGCAWGPRPINLHLEALEKLGAQITLDGGDIIAKADRLHGANINFDISSVGATGNTIMAAVLAKGESKIQNAAIEPEIINLCEYLISMGARIDGVGTSTLTVDGVDELHASNGEIIGDRIEAGTLLIAGALTKSKIEIEYNNINHIETVLSKLKDSGAKISINNNIVELDSCNIDANAVHVATAIYPGFPTDMQAQWIAYMALASGTSKVTDNIYTDRFSHVPELIRLGASIEQVNNMAIIHGVKRLKGAKVMSTDLRASASLVLAGLVAEGKTEVLRIYHIDRGYEKIEHKLSQLGAQIERVKTTEF